MSAFLDQRYFDWLYGQMCSVKRGSPSRMYKELFHILFTKEFVWLVPNDDNRVEDGKELRLEFLEQEGLNLAPYDGMWMELGCSFLEFLIALARRCSFEDGTDETVWFWEFLENLDLDGLTDREHFTREDVEEVLDRVMWRTYNPDGSGGLFPLAYADEDQRKVEIWYQLSAYILERS